MNYNLDIEHMQLNDSIDIDFGVILRSMEGSDPWNDIGEEMAVYDASAPAFIRQHDLDNLPGGSADV